MPIGWFFPGGGISKFFASGGFFPLIFPVGKTPLIYFTLPKYSPITDAVLKIVLLVLEVSGLLSLSVLAFLRIDS